MLSLGTKAELLVRLLALAKLKGVVEGKIPHETVPQLLYVLTVPPAHPFYVLTGLPAHLYVLTGLPTHSCTYWQSHPLTHCTSWRAYLLNHCTSGWAYPPTDNKRWWVHYKPMLHKKMSDYVVNNIDSTLPRLSPENICCSYDTDRLSLSYNINYFYCFLWSFTWFFVQCAV